MTATGRLTCPVCRRQLKLHHVLTLEERELAFERDARVSVNAQLYQRRHRRGGGAPPAILLGVLLDDRLPGDVA